MSAEQHSKDHSGWRIAKSAAKVASLGIGAGIVGVMGVTARHHREQTHQSIKLSNRLQQAIDLEQRSLGVAEPYTWASVHRVHHQMKDAALFPFYRIYHAFNEAKKRGITLPASMKIKHLDPFVESFDLRTAREIGAMADELVKERLGNKYKKPVFKTDAEIMNVLQPTEAQYHYPKYGKKNSAEDYTADDLARILLTDPHSPALMKRDNGVQGVALNNYNLYARAADAFRHNPSIMPEDLLKQKGIDKKQKMAVIGGFVMPIAAMLVLNRDFTPKGIGKAIIEGAAINGIRTATELFGGNATNSAGHMGDPVQTEIAQAFLSQTYEIKLKPDGTVSTNTVGKGITGRLASWATLDEVGGQQIHHQKPWKIAYTDATGTKAWVEAPWGSFLRYLADNKKFSFIERGENFNGQERPDVIHEAVRRIQKERAKQLAAANSELKT